MTTYTATFSNGIIISRKSHHDYRFAFLWTGKDANGRIHTRSGFSSSRELATKTMKGQCGWIDKRGDLTFAEVVEVTIPVGYTEDAWEAKKAADELKTASQIKLAYLTHALGYEAALIRLEKVGYQPNEADNYLFEKDATWHIAQIKNGETTEGPALLTEILNNRV